MAVNLAQAARMLKAARPHQVQLVLVTDSARLPNPLGPAARLPAGAWVILRHYGHPERTALAGRLARLCRARRLRLLVAGDATLAAAVRAHGIHLGEQAARRPLRALSWRRRHGGLLTMAAHGRPGLARAARLGADAVLLSPVFPTASHPGAPSLGVHRFARLARRTPRPVIALGGITGASARRLVGTGAGGLAAVGAFA